MNKKQLYESIMSSIAKQVKATLNEFYDLNNGYEDDYEDDEEETKKEPKVFTHDDLEEIKENILEDDDFYECFCNYGNMNYFDSYEDSINDFINFLENDLEDFTDVDPDFEGVHADFILDGPDLGSSWMRLKSGKYVNCDELYTTYKDCCSSI